jgi:MarR family transcriptional regulator, 2-MHQ and catechol-resistance regulon repressor
MAKETLKALITHLKANQFIKESIRKDVMNYQISLSEFMVIELLYHQGKQPIQMLAKKVLLTSGSMTYVINQLEKDEYILKIPCEKDQRITYVDLTAKGYQLMEQIFPQHEKKIEDIFSVLTEDELLLWIELHKRIGYKLEKKAKDTVDENI